MKKRTFTIRDKTRPRQSVPNSWSKIFPKVEPPTITFEPEKGSFNALYKTTRPLWTKSRQHFSNDTAPMAPGGNIWTAHISVKYSEHLLKMDLK